MDDDWSDRVLLRLSLAGGRREWNETQVADALREAAEAGTTAEELHGDADAFAAARLAVRPPEEVAAVTRDNRHAPHQGALGVLMGVATTRTVRTLWTDGWTTTVDVRTALASILFVALMCAAAVALALRSGGRPQASLRWWAGVAIGVGAIVVIGRTLPDDTPSTTLSSLVSLPAVAVIALAMKRVCDHVVDRSGEDWFDDLLAHLIGRHDVRPAAARNLAATTREHWAQVRAAEPDGPLDPAEEFGDLEVYAAALAIGAPRRPPLVRLLQRFQWRFSATVLTIAAVAALVGGASWWGSLVFAGAASLAVALAVSEVRTQRITRRAAADGLR